MLRPLPLWALVNASNYPAIPDSSAISKMETTGGAPVGRWLLKATAAFIFFDCLRFVF